jgi:hypothetical protein
MRKFLTVKIVCFKGGFKITSKKNIDNQSAIVLLRKIIHELEISKSDEMEVLKG